MGQKFAVPDKARVIYHAYQGLKYFDMISVLVSVVILLFVFFVPASRLFKIDTVDMLDLSVSEHGTVLVSYIVAMLAWGVLSLTRWQLHDRMTDMHENIVMEMKTDAYGREADDFTERDVEFIRRFKTVMKPALFDDKKFYKFAFMWSLVASGCAAMSPLLFRAV